MREKYVLFFLKMRAEFVARRNSYTTHGTEKEEWNHAATVAKRS